MKRVIVEYKNLSYDVLEALVNKYPDGFDDSDTVNFKNAKGQTVECVEIVVDDTDYLVKISKHLNLAMEEFDEDDDDNEMMDFEDDDSFE